MESVSTMNDLMYGEESTKEGNEGDGCSEARWEGSTVPSSAAALQNRESFSASQMSVLEKEARRLRDTGRFVSMAVVLQVMSRHKPVFDCLSPKNVEDKLRNVLRDIQLQGCWSQPKRRRTRH